MEEEENFPIVSGDVENIIIKLEPTEDFLDDEDSPVQEGIHSQVNEVEGSEDKVFFGEFCSGEDFHPPEENESSIIQTPFYLENYFSDNDSRNLNDLIDMNHFTCVDCKIAFPTERLLQEHFITHIDIHKMGCNVCDMDLNVAEKFQLHVMAITRQSIYFCDLCRKSCAGVVRSKDHTRPMGKTYACHDCEIEATKPSILNSSLPITPDHCKIENFYKIMNDNFKIEYKINGSKFNPDRCFHRCEYCDAFFAESFTLARHLRERHNLDKIKINALRNSKSTLNNETKTHTFKCKHCEVVFSKEFKLTKHLKEEHKFEGCKPKNVEPTVETKVSVKNKLKCNQCDVSYSENFNLRQKYKKGKKKFICKLCLKEFTLKKCYETHLSFHVIAKNYVCFACELTFSSKYELQQHLKIHNQDKKESKYKCDKKTSIHSQDKKESKYKSEKKTSIDVNKKRNTRRTRMKNS